MNKPPHFFDFDSKPRTESDVLRAKVQALEGALDQVKMAPMQLANVLRTFAHDGKSYVTLVNSSGTLLDLAVRRKDLFEKLEAGDYVWATPSGGVVDRSPPIAHLGVTVPVKAIVSDHAVEIDGPSGPRVVAWSKKRFPDVTEGSTVIIDRGGVVIVGAVSRAKVSEYVFEANTGVTWDDIGGLEDAKATLREAVELPLLHPELFRGYGKKPIRGVMLEGPPRCGKTMLAKAVASSLRSAGGAVGGAFFYVKGPEVLDRFVGVAEARVRGIFAAAREYHRQHGRPAVIFIDEADALLSARTGSPYETVTKTMVPQFLAEMDGLDESGAIVLLATNRAAGLDPAITGHGRIDRTVFVPPPTESVAREILALALRNVPIAPEGDSVPSIADFARRIAAEVFADRHVMRDGWRLVQAMPALRLRDVVNGAMLPAIVDVASSRAITRDLAAKKAEPTGVTFADVEGAIATVLAQEAHKNHAEERAAAKVREKSPIQLAR